MKFIEKTTEGPNSKLHLVAQDGHIDAAEIIAAGAIGLELFKRDYAGAPDALHKKYVLPGADDEQCPWEPL